MVAGVLAIAACLAVAFAAYRLAGYSWDQVVEYESPFADYSRPWSGDPAAASSEATAGPRLVLIIIDGLTLEASRSMAGLDTLRGYGADMLATTPQPSLSYPTWTTILSGAPPQISGVTTNWFEDKVPVETLIDVALAEGKRTVVVGPDSFDELYGAGRAEASYFKPWSETEYMSADFVTQTIDLVTKHDPEFLVLHLPDADETAHQHGAASEEYRNVVARIDTDIARLVTAMRDSRTTFVITADHGHIAAGGHGGWENDVTQVPALFFGNGVTLDVGDIEQVDIAPTTAALLGVRVPSFSVGQALENVLADDEPVPATDAQYRRFAERYIDILGGEKSQLGGARTHAEVRAVVERASADRLAEDRSARVPLGLALTGSALLALGILGALSWRVLVSALAGTAVYYAVYNTMYFVVHGHRWSLSAFNSEDLVQAFFNTRMLEAAVSGLLAVSVAAAVYPLLRRRPYGPKGSFIGGWLSLGPATILAIQATIAIQVAWFLWRWGAEITWRLPDLGWGFKYDLDLIQGTALGAAALLSPLVSYLVGRYHPRVRSADAERMADDASRATSPE